jgi:hypothetical protein
LKKSAQKTFNKCGRLSGQSLATPTPKESKVFARFFQKALLANEN